MNFAEFWSDFPAKSRFKGSKANAERLYNKLNLYERHAAHRSIPVYTEHLGENEWKSPMMVQTYLGPGRHWESFQPAEINEAEIRKLEESRRQIREANDRRRVQADREWRERYQQLVGKAP